jgi:nitrite reductase/ring-hydroxylating ferredoxin subunit/uncharacterized membrane protein
MDTARRIRVLIDQLGDDARLDTFEEPFGRIVRPLTRTNDAKRLLSGSDFGHRLHPLLTDIPIGAWTSATILDLIGGRGGRRVARRLVGVGIIASLPTAATGISDWDDTHGADRRVGIVHALANSTALGFQIASWFARGRGHRIRGTVLSAIGLGAVTAGGYLGGYLVFSRHVGVDVDVPVADLRAWRAVCTFDELHEGMPVGIDVDGARVVVVRRGEAAYALAATCSHAGGPLDEGCVNGGAIHCPWHGSQFALYDGAVRRGPATRTQPTYDARVHDGMVEIRGPVPPDTIVLSENERTRRAPLAGALSPYFGTGRRSAD